MHTVLAYDLQIPAGARKQEVEGRIEDILRPLRHVRRLSTFFIIHVETQTEWDSLLHDLAALSREIPETFRFIMSPPMEGGRYNGILPRDEWEEINAITRM